MKLTKNTTPQARDYQCNKCKSINCHKEMYNEDLCYSCRDELELEATLEVDGERKD